MGSAAGRTPGAWAAAAVSTQQEAGGRRGRGRARGAGCPLVASPAGPPRQPCAPAAGARRQAPRGLASVPAVRVPVGAGASACWLLRGPKPLGTSSSQRALSERPPSGPHRWAAARENRPTAPPQARALTRGALRPAASGEPPGQPPPEVRSAQQRQEPPLLCAGRTERVCPVVWVPQGG